MPLPPDATPADYAREQERTKILNFGTGDILTEKYRLVSRDGPAASAGVPEALGRGGSGVVFLADQMLHDGVAIRRAIKFYVYRDDIARFTAHRSSGPVSSTDFRDEILNLASVTHQNVLKVIEGGFWKSSYQGHRVPFLVTEFVDGPTLKEAIEKDSFGLRQLLRQRPELLIELILQLCQGVAHLHSRNFYHCDIAPKNIFLRQEGADLRLIIGDLGVGRTIPTKLDVGKPESTIFAVGTKDYAPPEIRQIINTDISLTQFRAFQPRWDLYAVAKSAAELVAVLADEGRPRPAWMDALEATLREAMDGSRFSSVAELERRVRLLHPQQHTIWEVQELSENAPGARQSLLPVESVITSPRIRDLSHHPVLLRLKRVPQLVMASKIFHGGSHDRFEHALGTYQNMRQYLVSLLNDYEFLVSFSPAHAELSLVSALLSGIARFPFSTIVHELHGSDRRLFTEFSRESIYRELVEFKPSDSRPLSFQIQRGFPRVNQAELEILLTGGPVRQPDNALRFVHFLLNSSIDVRVLDYLRRDSLHLGMTMGGFPLDDLLRHIRFREGQLVVHSRGLSAVEQIITVRYWLFNRIYWNSPNRTLIAMLRYVFRELCSSVTGFAGRLREKVLWGSEDSVLEFVSDQASASMQTAVLEVCKFLLSDRPKLYEEIVQLNRAEGDAAARVACDRYGALRLDQKVALQTLMNDRIVAQFGLPIDRQHILIDMPTEYGAMKLGEDINVEGYREWRGQDAKSKPQFTALSKLSGIVEGVQKSFVEHIQRLRILIHPETAAATKAHRERLAAEMLDFVISSLA